VVYEGACRDDDDSLVDLEVSWPYQHHGGMESYNKQRTFSTFGNIENIYLEIFSQNAFKRPDVTVHTHYYMSI